MEISGKQFNQIFPITPFYKFTNEDEQHHHMQYHTGLNEDLLEFDPTGECKAGGLYFTDVFHVGFWYFEMSWVRLVTIPDDARVYIEHKKYKADKFILGERVPIEEFRIPKQFQLEALKLCPTSILFIDVHTEDFVMLVLRANPYLLHLVNDVSEKAALFAVTKYGNVLQHVPFTKRSLPVCVEAVKQNKIALMYVPEQHLVDLFMELYG